MVIKKKSSLPLQLVQGVNKTFPIVGIGASAGGLEAFESFFRHIPVDSDMAFVLVQHLDPTHVSLLSEILQRSTSMPVIEALDQIKVEPNHVYIIPPNRDMEIFHGMLQLSVPTASRGHRMPINAFLRSLAEDQEENAVGIILSGTGTDGTLGLRAIIGVGGITFVQEPASAKYDGMPTSAIQAGYAMHILPVEKIPEMLTSSSVTQAQHSIPESTTVGNIAYILMLLRTATGHDFSLYKKSTINRRIERRMLQYCIEDKKIYARFLKEHPAEIQILFKELLINVTSFFRDPEAFAVLQQDILPQLCKDKPDDHAFRVWVAGCATGEEAYSIAILLREWMDENKRKLTVQIYSTDIDDDAIAIARKGIYPFSIEQNITPERLYRFFIKEDSGYRIKKEIREMVVFATQNITRDPPFTRLDLLSCRNLMIYLEPELQNQLIPSFHFALKPNGVLLLSPSETIGNHAELFSPIDRKWKLYRATPDADSNQTMTTRSMTWAKSAGAKTPEEIMTKPKKTNLAELTRQVLVQHFAPASVVTSLKGDILYVHGETGKYLRPAPGQATLNVIEMAREGLERELSSMIQAAASQNVPTLPRKTLVKTNGGYTTVSVSVRLLPATEGSQNLLLISFQDIADAPVKSKRKRTTSPAELEQVSELEHKLAQTKEDLQTIVDEQQIINEELKSTNEELQSTNEELQSSNEEIETSKEELQSTNEELITVNAELQDRIRQSISIQNDMKNLLDNVNSGTIFLDGKMAIRRFTREATKIFPLVTSDVGRPLADIKSSLKMENLLFEVGTVLETLVPFECEVHARSGAWYLLRIQPYRTLDNVIEGVVLTFTDISQRIRAEEILRQTREFAENIIETLHEPLLVLDVDLNVISANPAFYRYFRVGAADTIGSKIYNLGDHQWDIPSLRKLLEEILPQEKTFSGYEVEHDFPIIGQRKIRLNARQILNKENAPQLILLTMEIPREL